MLTTLLLATSLLVESLLARRASAQGARSSIEVRYTAYGVPHVRATTLAGAGEGYGWAFARDNLCLMLDKTVTLAGERSRYFGADSAYFDGFLYGTVGNAASDVFYRYMLASPAVAAVRAAASADVRALVRGYVRGFNRHVAATPLPGETCRAQPWFRPITEQDVWRRFTQMPLLQTSIVVLREIAAATPPAKRGAGAPQNLDDNTAVTALSPTLIDRAAAIGGSNALAAGRAVLGAGVGGFSFSNPHFPWQGTERLHAMHLTVPGKLDVFGATLYGMPFPLLGFTPYVGWSLTHTTDKRSTIFELTLDPADPTRYRIGEIYEKMTPVDIAIPTASDTIHRTIWETRYGPVVVAPGIGWSNERAYVFADPERGNVRMGDQFLSFSSARSVYDLQSSLRRHLGSPWSNVTAADRAGNVLYANISVAGYTTDAQWERCRVTSAARAYENITDVTVLNGSDPTCAWTRDARAPQAGLIPAALRPSTIRQDIALNSNDSHWYPSIGSNTRLEGFPQVIGPERTVRGERTRVAALYANSFDAKAGRALTPTSWEQLFFSARNYTAELMVDDLVADCRAQPVVTMESGTTVDVTAGCRALASWDRTDQLSSRGSMLFAEFMRNLERVPMTGFSPAPRYWRVPFDAADPIGTPRGLVASDETRRALARAVTRITAAGVALDAPLGDVQAAIRDGKRLPLSGASYTYHMGSPANLVNGVGITDLRTGDSYIHAVLLSKSAPRGRFIVTYSQSTNPLSPHAADMTAAFSAQRWLDVAFTPREIAAAQVGPTVRW